jgi:hypothetical protein
MINNTLALHVCESLINTIKNEKSQDFQKILSEMYVQIMNLKDKTEEIRKSHMESRMRVNKYLYSMKKMDRIIRE